MKTLTFCYEKAKLYSRNLIREKTNQQAPQYINKSISSSFADFWTGQSEFCFSLPTNITIWDFIDVLSELPHTLGLVGRCLSRWNKLNH